LSSKRLQPRKESELLLAGESRTSRITRCRMQRLEKFIDFFRKNRETLLGEEIDVSAGVLANRRIAQSPHLIMRDIGSSIKRTDRCERRKLSFDRRYSERRAFREAITVKPGMRARRRIFRSFGTDGCIPSSQNTAAAAKQPPVL